MKTIAALAFLVSAFAFAKTEVPSPELQAAVKKITDGKIEKVEKERDGLTASFEIDISTPDRSVEEIEVARDDFRLLKAEGEWVEGTRFEPGQKLHPLSHLAKELKKYPDFSPQEWELERKITGRWIYDISGVEKGKEREYKFDAETLKLVKVEND